MATNAYVCFPAITNTKYTSTDIKFQTIGNLVNYCFAALSLPMPSSLRLKLPIIRSQRHI